MEHSSFHAPAEAPQRRRASRSRLSDRPRRRNHGHGQFDGRTLTYTHDEAGNVRSVADARNITAQYGYDGLNRVTGIDYPGTDEDVALTYDSYTGCTNGIGRLCNVQDQSGTTEYAYDGFGNMAQVTRTESGTTYATRYAYDPVNRVISITYSDGRAVRYTRDVLGRIAEISMVKDGVTTVLASNITYRADGLIRSLTYGNGLTETRTYSLKGELTDQTLGSGAFNYSYDLNGNLTQAIRASGTSLYTYDALDRLTQETSASIGQLGYSYDPNGNRLSFLDNGETKAYSYAPNTNRLTQIGYKEVVLDAAGNTLSKDNGKWKYEYGQSGRLFKAYKERKLIATYLYNTQGQRTQKITKHGTTVYHYDLAGHLIAETDKNGELQRAYVWLDNLPLVQIDVKGKVHEHRRKPRKEHIAYLHTDHLGTPRLATDANRQVVWRWESDAFGAKKPEDLDDEHEDDDRNEITVNLRNDGQYLDKETGLFYNWHRYYDPKTGRYLSADSLGIEAGLNPFTYVDNNPLRWIDPTGQAKIGGGKIIPFPIPAPPAVPGAPSAPGAGDVPGVDEPSSGSRSREGARERPKRCEDDPFCGLQRQIRVRSIPPTDPAAGGRNGLSEWLCYYECSGNRRMTVPNVITPYGCPEKLPYNPAWASP